MITENQIRARLAGQANVERKRIAELRASATRSAQRARAESNGPCAHAAGGRASEIAMRRFLAPAPIAAAPRPSIVNDNILYHA